MSLGHACMGVVRGSRSRLKEGEMWIVALAFGVFCVLCWIGERLAIRSERNNPFVGWKNGGVR